MNHDLPLLNRVCEGRRWSRPGLGLRLRGSRSAALLLLFIAPLAFSGPGAHGPNGEHLDSAPAVRAASALPRVDAATDAFELVAELRSGELSILIDRYETNEPVSNATLEVESGALKAVAAFRAEQGDYVVTDAALLKSLAAPGEHGVVFTLVAGKDSDLLEGTLVSGGGRVGTAEPKGHGHTHASGGAVDEHGLQRAVWVGAGIAALGLVGAVAWWRQRRRGPSELPGGF